MSHIPTWVYVLFFGLLYVGIKRCYTRVVNVKRIVTVPLIFAFFSIHSTVELFHFSLESLLVLLLAGFVGGLAGHVCVRKRIIRADKNKQLIEIPGDFFMLLMVMTIFAIEFFIHYAIEAHLAISQQDLFNYIAVILSGLIVGLSIGRCLTYFIKYRNAESVELAMQQS